MYERLLSSVAAVGLLASLAACGRGILPLPKSGPPPSSPARADVAPKSGLEVIGAMRREYPSRALRSLTYSVTTTDFRSRIPRERTARGYASLPGRFRIAQLPMTSKTGWIRDRQRLAVFERGRRVSSFSRRPDLAQLMAYDVFAQSIDSTISMLDSVGVRFGTVRRDEHGGRRMWVVGASAGDTVSPQFWIDAKTWRVARVIQKDPRNQRETLDIRFLEFAEYVAVPVPLRVAVYRNGRLEQDQTISNVSVNPDVPTRAFDVSRWRDVGG